MGAVPQKRLISSTVFVVAGQSIYSGKFKHLKYSENVNYEGTNSVDSILGVCQHQSSYKSTQVIYLLQMSSFSSSNLRCILHRQRCLSIVNLNSSSLNLESISISNVLDSLWDTIDINVVVRTLKDISFRFFILAF